MNTELAHQEGIWSESLLDDFLWQIEWKLKRKQCKLTVSQMANTDWLGVCDYYARRLYGGHLSAFRFTSGWKVFFGTMHLNHGSEDYETASETAIAPTQEQASRDLLLREGLITHAEAVSVENARHDKEILHK